MGGHKYVNRGDMIGNWEDRIIYRGNMMVNKGYRFRKKNDHDWGLNTNKVTLPRVKESSDQDKLLEWKIQSEEIFLKNNILELWR